jgi:YegS/Rv2252/BmrU family lipid kinase
VTASTVVIVNPHSQGGAAGRAWPHLADRIRRVLPFEDRKTTGPGDATRLAREAIDAGAERVIALGGDGTINEVMNGFFEDGAAISPSAALGILPFGTGGDFRKSVHVPADFDDAVAVLGRDRRKTIDVGRVDCDTPDGARTSRMFVNIASFGIPGVVDRLINKSSKRFGKLSFMAATVRSMFEYENQRVRIVFDGVARDSVEMTINTVAIANGRYFGGGMQIAPGAELDDGFFEVVAIGDVGVGRMILNSRRIYKGTHIGLDDVSHRRARSVTAEPLDPSQIVEIDLDGETPGRLPATFTVVPQALRLVC